MTGTAAILPKHKFTSATGIPLANGTLTTYLAGTTTLSGTWQDSDLSTANTNPIELDAAGECTLWLDRTKYYKMVLKNSAGVTQWTQDNIAGWGSLSSDAGLIGYTPAGTGAVDSTVQTKLRESVSVLDFGADSTGLTDSTTAFLNAYNTGKRIYAPAGIYSVNVTFPNKFILFGDGSTHTIIKPFNTATAAITYTGTSPYWTYASEVRDVQFLGSAQVGIGFTFGASTQAAYVAGMEFANNVNFYNCFFTGLQKGVQFPFGNIGSSFYDCGFTGNYYGVYLLDNKNYPSIVGSTLMHGGNKYFYGGQFDGNICAVYINNNSLGFGGIVFNGAIIEYNNVGIYLYTASTGAAPVVFNDIWNEGNGAFVSASQINIDVFSGEVPTATAFNPHAMIFDGSDSSHNWNGGIFQDCYLKATNARVLCNNSRVESLVGFGGYPCQVDDANSAIYMTNPETSGGVPVNSKTFVRGNFRPINTTSLTSNNQSRQAWAMHRFNKLAGSYGAANQVINLTASSGMTGVGIVASNTTQSDGVIYGTCNEYTTPFTVSTQSAYLTAAVTVAASGWYVVTFDVKLVSGTPQFFIWDGSNQIVSSLQPPETGVWYTCAAIGKYTAGGSFYMSVYPNAASVGTCVFRLSAYQRVRFDTEHEAQAFLESNVYIGP